MFTFTCYPKNYHPSFALRCFQIFLLILIVIGLALIATQKIWVPKMVDFIITPGNGNAHFIASATYVCEGEKGITATYEDGPVLPPLKKDGPPRPTGKVALKFTDGRDNMTLSQTISADGARYANTDESFIFWGKGGGAMILQNGVEKSYLGCVLIAKESKHPGLSEVYRGIGGKFSLRYPKGYSIDETYRYEPDPGISISGVKFTIPFVTAKGTNLSGDSYISVENLPNVDIPKCSAKLFFPRDIPVSIISDENYSIASTTGAGAGNRYEETVYAFPDTNPCIAIRYFIHFMVFENYPVGMVKEFNKTSLLQEFDQIRHTFILQ